MFVGSSPGKGMIRPQEGDDGGYMMVNNTLMRPLFLGVVALRGHPQIAMNTKSSASNLQKTLE